MTMLAALLLLLPGFAMLAVSMPKHHRELLGRPLGNRRRRILRLSGWSLLALALVPATIGRGLSVGLVLWFALATLAALVVALMLTYRDYWWRI